MSFTVVRERSLAIVGESGSGKTTVARLIIGLERPTAGTITVLGEDQSRPAAQASRAPPAWPPGSDRVPRPVQLARPVAAHRGAASTRCFAFTSSCLAAERRRRTDRAARAGGARNQDGRALPRALSGGQRQRAAIARALAAEPTILILDEAVAALDVSIQAQVLNRLADLREETGMTYIFISHDLSVVRQLTQEAIVMQRGTIVERGPTARVLDDPEHEYTQAASQVGSGPGWKPKRAWLEHDPGQSTETDVGASQ